jgi:hypothetical protein
MKWDRTVAKKRLQGHQGPASLRSAISHHHIKGQGPVDHTAEVRVLVNKGHKGTLNNQLASKTPTHLLLQIEMAQNLTRGRPVTTSGKPTSGALAHPALPSDNHNTTLLSVRRHVPTITPGTDAPKRTRQVWWTAGDRHTIVSKQKSWH